MDTPARFAAGVSLGVAVVALLGAKTSSNCRPKYVRSLRTYLSAFSKGREGDPVSSISVESVEEWFARRKEAVSTRVSNTGRLSALFSFCVRRGWITVNPCTFLEKVRLEPRPPKILSVQEAQKLISFVRETKKHQLAFWTLGLYCGVRPEEIEHLRWDNICLNRGMVFVDAAASKVRRRRIVPMNAKAHALLKEAREYEAKLPIPRHTRKKYLARACRVLGYETWPQDLLRHSAASYWLSLTQDAGKVALALGNSPRVLLTNYQELVPRETAEEFWKLE